jgi:hypothetical protein
MPTGLEEAVTTGGYLHRGMTTACAICGKTYTLCPPHDPKCHRKRAHSDQGQQCGQNVAGIYPVAQGCGLKITK